MFLKSGFTTKIAKTVSKIYSLYKDRPTLLGVSLAIIFYKTCWTYLEIDKTWLH